MNSQPPVALDAAGPFAAPLVDLSWVLFWVVTVVLLVVAAAVAIALFGSERLRAFIGRRWMIVAGGLAFPIVVLSGLLVYGLLVTDKVSAAPTAGEMRIRVIGEMWWWRIQYLDGDTVRFETANEVRVPVGQPFTLELQSNDVIHAYWVPQLGPKRDMIPGRTNLLRLQADRAGVFRGQCSEYCGSAHAMMANEVIAVSQDEFDAWAAQQAGPLAQASTDAERLFMDSGCGACHTVRGTSANGRLGPDLTHVSSRRTLAAGMLENTPEIFRDFIRNAGRLKPGIRMPEYSRLSADEIEAIASWLENRP